MTKEADKKIAEWLGWQYDEGSDCWMIPTAAGIFECQDGWQPRLSAEIILTELVKRGFFPELYYTVDSEGFAAWYFTENPGQPYFLGKTAIEAIKAAVSVMK